MLTSFVRTLKKSRNARLGLVIVTVVILVALAAPWLAPSDPRAQSLTQRLLSPSAGFPLGSDSFGRDVLSRLIWGARISLAVGFFSVAVSSLIGTTLGVMSGYFGGWVDTLIMRLVDMMMAFPAILLALTIVAILGSSLRNVMFAIAITFSPGFARVIRSITLSVREQGYVLAARAAGTSDWVTIVKHVVPNVVSSAVVLMTLQIGTAITVEAGLSFLGLGGDPAVPSWGSVISDGRGFLQNAPWISGFAGVAITLTVIGFNLLGDAIRDTLDPRVSRQM